MYYLLEGKVKIEQTAFNGKSILFAFAGEDSWLGDLELFGDSEEANPHRNGDHRCRSAALFTGHHAQQPQTLPRACRILCPFIGTKDVGLLKNEHGQYPLPAARPLCPLPL